MGTTSYMIDRELFGNAIAATNEGSRVLSDDAERARKRKRDYSNEKEYPDSFLEERLERLKKADENLEPSKSWAKKHLPGAASDDNDVLRRDRDEIENTMTRRKDVRAVKKGVRGLMDFLRGKKSAPERTAED